MEERDVFVFEFGEILSTDLVFETVLGSFGIFAVHYGYGMGFGCISSAGIVRWTYTQQI